eukprot:COSAG01_NODE_9222_length_2514_cov_1.659213_6_plen_27_part_01
MEDPLPLRRSKGLRAARETLSARKRLP